MTHAAIRFAIVMVSFLRHRDRRRARLACAVCGIRWPSRRRAGSVRRELPRGRSWADWNAVGQRREAIASAVGSGTRCSRASSWSWAACIREAHGHPVGSRRHHRVTGGLVASVCAPPPHHDRKVGETRAQPLAEVPEMQGVAGARQSADEDHRRRASLHDRDGLADQEIGRGDVHGEATGIEALPQHLQGDLVRLLVAGRPRTEAAGRSAGSAGGSERSSSSTSSRVVRSTKRASAR